MALVTVELSRLATSFMIGLIPGLFAGIFLAGFWSPFLFSDRIREFFRGYPLGGVGFNYIVTFVPVAMLHFSLLFSFLLVYGNRETVFEIIFISCVGTPITAALLRQYLAPRISDLEKVEIDLVTALLGIAGILWYSTLTMAPLIFLTGFYYMPM